MKATSSKTENKRKAMKNKNTKLRKGKRKYRI